MTSALIARSQAQSSNPVWAGSLEFVAGKYEVRILGVDADFPPLQQQSGQLLVHYDRKLRNTRLGLAKLAVRPAVQNVDLAELPFHVPTSDPSTLRFADL
jgi:hypothetical protein